MSDFRALFRILAARLERRARRDLLLRRGVAGLFFGLAPALAAAVLAGTITLPVPALPLAAGLAAAGCASGILSAFVHPVDRRRLLIRADRVLGSRELISTALDLVDSDASGLFVDAVLEDAAQLLSRTPPRTILGRLKLPYAPFAGIALALTIAGLIFPVNLRALFPPRVDAASELAQIGEDLRNRGQRLVEEARARDLGRSLELAQQLAQLGSDLTAKRIQQEDALDRMSELEAGLAEEYQLRLQEAQPAFPSGKAGSGGTGIGPEAGKSGVPGKAGTSGEAGQSSDASSDAESASGDADHSLKDLGDTLDKLRQSRRQLEGEGYGDSSQAQSPSRPRRPRSSSEAQRGLQGIPPGEGEAGRSAQRGQDPGTTPGGSGESGGTEQQGAGEPGSGFGTLPAPVKRGDPTTIIEGGRGPGLQAQGNPAEGDSTRLLARALPQWTGAQLPEETILNAYSRQAESALARDQVPLKLKQYVKEYFTIIGISK
jgi:hypothetical protein